MNFDILIKLVKLANHNNAEGEANAAARRVCKMLSEDNYKWIESVVKGGPKVAANKVGGTGNYGTWGGVHRSKEPDFRSSRGPRSSGFNPYEDEFADWFKKWGSQFSEEANRRSEEEAERRYREQQAQKDKEYKEREEQKAKYRYGHWDERTYEYVDPTTDWSKTKKENEKSQSQKEADERRRQKKEEAKKKWEAWEKDRPPKGPINYTFNQQKEGAKGYKKIYIERLRRCVSCGYDRLTTEEQPAYVCASCKRNTP